MEILRRTFTLHEEESRNRLHFGVHGGAAPRFIRGLIGMLLPGMILVLALTRSGSIGLDALGGAIGFWILYVLAESYRLTAVVSHGRLTLHIRPGLLVWTKPRIFDLRGKTSVRKWMGFLELRGKNSTLIFIPRSFLPTADGGWPNVRLVEFVQAHLGSEEVPRNGPDS